VLVEEEDHTLGLSLVELCLREAGWSSLWAGRRTPLVSLASRLSRLDVELVCVSASLASRDDLALAQQAELLGRACAEARVRLFLGGRGAWPTASPHAQLVTEFQRLHTLVS
jgi:hypothetical protein